MLLIRLLGNALCAAVAAFVIALVFLTGAAHVGRQPGKVARDHRVPGGTPVNVLDVAPGVPPAHIAALIQLRPGEHVSEVNDRVPASDLEVGALIASLPRRGEFLDLTVASPAGARRVLVLLH